MNRKTLREIFNIYKSEIDSIETPIPIDIEDFEKALIKIDLTKPDKYFKELLEEFHPNNKNDENKFKEIKLIKKIYNNYMKKNNNIIYKNG
jgi:hypothetical protein